MVYSQPNPGLSCSSLFCGPELRVIYLHIVIYSPQPLVQLILFRASAGTSAGEMLWLATVRWRQRHFPPRLSRSLRTGLQEMQTSRVKRLYRKMKSRWIIHFSVVGGANRRQRGIWTFVRRLRPLDHRASLTVQ
jgi:hypothetical protein